MSKAYVYEVLSDDPARPMPWIEQAAIEEGRARVAGQLRGLAAAVRAANKEMRESQHRKAVRRRRERRSAESAN